MNTRWMLSAALALPLLLALPARAIDPKPALPEPDAQGLYAGYRALSLPMSGYKIVFLEKGQRVDVMVTFDAVMKDKRKEKVTATILMNVVVVNVQKPAKLEENGVVELLLNPNETQYAALSLYQGELSIARRAAGDTTMAPLEMASLRKLFR
ncbi:MAG: hypothetical protein PHU21_02155 [Elusimicrobia bacterium]|nr:hypothetical protein [Elusimicrobiota bacterium]